MDFVKKFFKNVNPCRWVGSILLGILVITPVFSISHEIQHGLSHAQASHESSISADEVCSLCTLATDQRTAYASPTFVNAVKLIVVRLVLNDLIFDFTQLRELPRSRGPPAA